jgi:putative sterol carrier protein
VLAGPVALIGCVLSLTKTSCPLPTLQLEATVRALTEIWSGDTTPLEAMRAKEIRVLGAKRDAEKLWRWLGTSAFAQTRQAARKDFS